MLVPAPLKRVAVLIRILVIQGQHRHHRVLRKRYPAVLALNVVTVAQKADVGTTLRKPCFDLLTHALKQLYSYIGVVTAKVGYDLRQPVRRNGGIRRNGDGADVESLDLGGKLIYAALLPYIGAHGGQQRLSLRRERNALLASF